MSTGELKRKIQGILHELRQQEFVQENEAASSKLEELNQDIQNDFFVVVVLG